jgi:hypothetical protein
LNFALAISDKAWKRTKGFWMNKIRPIVSAAKNITDLTDAIRATHGCESFFVESVPIKEVFKDQIAWEGTVEVFALINHPKTKKHSCAHFATEIKTRQSLCSLFRRRIRHRTPSKW